MADKFASGFEPGQTVVIAQGDAYPSQLIARLASLPEKLAGSRIIVGLAKEPLPRSSARELLSFFPSGPLGEAENFAALGGRYWRATLFQKAMAFESGAIGVDVAMLRVSKPRNGFYSVAFSSDYILAAIKNAKRLVLEQCPDAPWLGSHIASNDDRITCVEQGPPGLRPAGPVDKLPRLDPLSMQMKSVLPAALRNASAIQVGLGSWTNGVAQILPGWGKAVHSGFVDRWLLDALTIDPGAVTSVTTTGIAPLADLCQLAERLLEDGRFSLASAYESHHPRTLANIAGLVSINSVWQVDLQSRANCEFLMHADGSETRGGIAGLGDFAVAAALQPNGRSILCLRSTDKDGSTRIVPRLSERQISLPPQAVDMVVTEHGATDLRNLPLETRAQAMIASVVDPAFRGRFKEGIAAPALTDKGEKHGRI